jgi:hypothetical protein
MSHRSEKLVNIPSYMLVNIPFYMLSESEKFIYEGGEFRKTAVADPPPDNRNAFNFSTHADALFPQTAICQRYAPEPCHPPGTTALDIAIAAQEAGIRHLRRDIVNLKKEILDKEYQLGDYERRLRSMRRSK